MSKQDYRTFWRRFDPVPSEWLERTSRWLEGMSSSDGSILITHNDGGINLQVGGITDGRAGGGVTSISVAATTIDLMPESRVNGFYLQHRQKLFGLSISGTRISLRVAATYSDWVNGCSLCSATEA